LIMEFLRFILICQKVTRKKLSTRIPIIVKSFDEIVQKFPNLKSNFQDNTIQEIKDIGEWVIGAYTIQRL